MRRPSGSLRVVTTPVGLFSTTHSNVDGAAATAQLLGRPGGEMECRVARLLGLGAEFPSAARDAARQGIPGEPGGPRDGDDDQDEQH